MKKIFLLTIFISSLLGACSQPTPKGSFSFSMKNGMLYNQKLLFTGIKTSYWPNGNKKSTDQYLNGLRHGKSYHWHQNGVLLWDRNYINGQKSGQHLSWHQNGKKRFLFNFANGVHSGENWIWHDNGQVSELFIFNDAKEIGHKKWRRSGKIFWNTVINENTGGDRGLKGGRLCTEIKGGDNESALVNN